MSFESLESVGTDPIARTDTRVTFTDGQALSPTIPLHWTGEASELLGASCCFIRKGQRGFWFRLKQSKNKELRAEGHKGSGEGSKGYLRQPSWVPTKRDRTGQDRTGQETYSLSPSWLGIGGHIMSAGDLRISRTSSSPTPSPSSSSSPRQRRALQPWHVFPVRVRSSRSSGSGSDATETSALSQSRRRSADGHRRHGSDARPRSSRRDNSSSATAGSTASGRWSIRTHPSWSSLEGDSSMLPGVEFARRRRVHSVGRDNDSPATGFGLVDGRPSRARPGSTVAHHHHHYHHHHHHHHHHYHQSASEQAPTRTRSSSGRLGGLRTAGEAASNEARPSSSRQQGVSSSTASNTEGSDRNVRSERTFRLPSWMQRSSTTSNLREEALEARDRLDERLRAAALVSQSVRRPRTSLPGHPQADYSFVVPQGDEHSSNSDEDVWETSMREWLAAWAPAGTDDRFRHDIRSRSARMERPKGISKATIGALPREMYCTRAKKRVKEKGSCEQEECPVCLEHFVVGEVLLCLPCNHRFHPDCLTPWLESHGLCPYCRAKVPEAAKAQGTSGTGASTSAVDGVPDGEDLVSWMTAIERGITRLSFRVSNC